jgi:hypothetical protein
MGEGGEGKKGKDEKIVQEKRRKMKKGDTEGGGEGRRRDEGR